jgi:predicted esterase
LAPENNVNKLDNKQIYLGLSKADVVIPYSCGIKFKKTLEKNKYKIKYNENKYLGHYLTILRFIYFPKKILNSLKDKK